MAKFPKMSKPEKPPLQPMAEGGLRLEVDAKTEELIGRFIVSWNHLEHAIGNLVWAILNVDGENGRVFTSRVDIKTKIEWIRVFAQKYLEGGALDKMASIINVVEIIQPSRNLIAHGAWCTMNASGDPVVMSLKTKTQPDQIECETFPHNRLEELIFNIRAARIEIMAWQRRHESSLGK